MAMHRYSASRNPAVLLLAAATLTLSACSTQGTSRYGGEAIVDCVPASMPCTPAPIYRPAPMQAQPPVYVPAPVAPSPQAAPLPATPLPSKPASPVYEPYVPETMPDPYTSEPYTPEPYAPLPPIRSNRPVVDDPAELPCPEGSIPGYGGTDCILITVPRK